MGPNSVSHMFVEGSHAFAMVYAQRTYKRDDLYPICSKLQYRGLLALYAYGSTMHVATL